MSLFQFGRAGRGASRRPLRRAALVMAVALGSASGTFVAEPSTASAAAPAPGNGSAGLTPTPPMGWSSWDYVRKNPSAANIEAEADYLVSSGLSAAGYKLVSIDDFWMSCNTYSSALGRNTYDTDANGYWTPNSAFPGGIKPVADYVHKLGLQLGVYLTPGVPWSGDGKPIVGTGYTTDQIKVASTVGQGETNYNCATVSGGNPGGNSGMDYIDYNTPATPNAGQDYVNGWADLLASWGVDHLKLDGVGSNDPSDIQAWSSALQQAPRPISLTLSNGNGVGLGTASTAARYANTWRIDGDVNSYQGNTVYPLTSWSKVSSRFDDAAAWAAWGGSGHWNDLDSIEVGNGGNDGITVDERWSTLALWAMASSPLMVGADLTQLDATDLAMLKNPGLIHVDQNGSAATRVYNQNGLQVWSKDVGGETAVAFFNSSGSAETYDVGRYVPSVAMTGADVVTDLLGNAGLQPVPSSPTDRTITVPSHGAAIVGITGPAGLQPAACGTSYSFTVPAGAHTARALVAGAPGQTAWGVNGGGGNPGGAGSAVLATFGVTPGQTLSAVTGCSSTTNSGGVGWSTGGSSMPGGGAGGGSSAVCASNTCTAGNSAPLVVAGGGGGGGGGTCGGYWGWRGGDGGGNTGSITSNPGSTGSGPSGANGVAGGNPGGSGGANDGSTGNNGSPNGGGGWVHNGDSGGGAGLVGGWGGNDWGWGCQSQGGGGGGSSWASNTALAGAAFSTSQVAGATIWFS